MACSLCKKETAVARDDVIYTLKRTGLSTMTDGSVTLSDVKEHRFPVCDDCVKKEKRLRAVLGIATLALFIGGFIVMMTRSPDDDLWFVGLGAAVVGLAGGFFALRKLSYLHKLMKLALNERNLPGYTAMTKGEYDAFEKAAKWDRGSN